MTLPTTTTLSDHCDDDSDMFGPPRSTPPIGYHHHRSRVPMISPKLRQREERKRILQLCAHKLERIKDSETNLRRSVCINNTYCRLTDELRREKQSRYLANLPKSDTKPETARDNIFNPYNSCGIDSSNHQPSTKLHQQQQDNAASRTIYSSENQPSNGEQQQQQTKATTHNSQNNNHHSYNNIADNNLHHTQQHTHHHQQQHFQHHHHHHHHHQQHQHSNNSHHSNMNTTSTPSTTPTTTRKRQPSSNNLDNDLEILDRELSAINAPMPLIDPEITQGAEQLEKAISSRKRLRSEDESDRLVREALSQFYIPPQRLISAIEDCPLDAAVSAAAAAAAAATNGHHHSHHNHKRSKIDLELDFDMNQNQKEFEVIMDALRLGTPSPSSDSCGQAAMMSESSVFHNLVVTSLET